jgi:CubicO group peptidase (beta-lactamase class C family)
MVGRRGSAALWILAVLASGCSGNDADRSGATRPEVQRMLEYVHSEGAPGVSALVRDRSGTCRGSAGLAVLQPRRTMRPVDRFRIASVTKTFVATVLLQLVAEGRLRLNDTVERRLPAAVPQGRRITVRQLLNHTSGLYDYIDDPASRRDSAATCALSCRRASRWRSRSRTDLVSRPVPAVGIFRTELACGYAWGHDGAMPGYLTRVLASKDGSHVVVMAANGDSMRVGGALAASATNAYCTS